MTLQGTGAVAIWHDLLPEARHEFYQWHGQEHMPERVGIPGFRRGRRYVAVSGGPEFFNLYEADELATVCGPEYLARLNNPTAWTRQVVASFRNVARSTCTVAYSAGCGDGGHMLTLCLPACDAELTDLLVNITLPDLAGRSGISGVHFLLADVASSNMETREKAARGDATAVPTHIILIEGVSQTHVTTGAGMVLAAIEANSPESGNGIIEASYILEHATESRC